MTIKIGLLCIIAALALGAGAGAWDRWRGDRPGKIGCWPLLVGVLAMVVGTASKELIIEEAVPIVLGMMLAFGAGYLGLQELRDRSFLFLPYVVLVAAIGAAIVFWDWYETPEWGYDYRYCTTLTEQEFRSSSVESRGRWDEEQVAIETAQVLPTSWRYDPTGKIYTSEDVAHYRREHRVVAVIPLVGVVLLTALVLLMRKR